VKRGLLNLVKQGSTPLGGKLQRKESISFESKLGGGGRTCRNHIREKKKRRREERGREHRKNPCCRGKRGNEGELRPRRKI